MSDTTANPKPCPICSRDMDPIDVRNSLSRYTDRYICNACGGMEATLTLGKLHPEGRECLWYEPVSGALALVNEKISGYRQLADVHTSNEAFVRDYVVKVNSRLGFTEAEAHDIVEKSMFHADLTWKPQDEETRR